MMDRTSMIILGAGVAIAAGVFLLERPAPPDPGLSPIPNQVPMGISFVGPRQDPGPAIPASTPALQPVALPAVPTPTHINPITGNLIQAPHFG